MEHKHKPQKLMAEVWTKTKLKAADDILLVLNGLPADEQDTILEVVRVLLAHERKQIALAVSQEMV